MSPPSPIITKVYLTLSITKIRQLIPKKLLTAFFVADAPMKKNNTLVLPPFRALLLGVGNSAHASEV